MNERDREAIIARFPKASPAFLAANGLLPAVAPQLPVQKPQPNPRVPLERAPQAQGGGEVSPRQRYRVTLARHGSRLLDVDNLAASFKWLIDACRYQGLIPNDDPASVELVFNQKKVPKKHQGTEIFIERLQ